MREIEKIRRAERERIIKIGWKIFLYGSRLGGRGNLGGINKHPLHLLSFKRQTKQFLLQLQKNVGIPYTEINELTIKYEHMEELQKEWLSKQKEAKSNEGS